jgi:adenosylcobyric acid synthase
MGRSKKVHPGGRDMIPLFNIKSRGKKTVDISDGFIKFNGENNTPVLGTYIHGVFDNYIFRKIVIGFLRKIHKGGPEKPGPDLKSYKDFKEAQYEALARLFRENMDMKLFYKILKHGL